MNIFIGNILGFIASLIGIGFFKSNNKNKICIYSIFMICFQIASMSVLGAYSGLIVVSCNMLRAILTRFTKWNIYWILFVEIIIISFTFYIYKTPLDFFSILESTFNNIGFIYMQKNKIKKFRLLRFCGNILWISYYYYIYNFMSMLFEIIYTVINLKELSKKEKI